MTRSAPIFAAVFAAGELLSWLAISTCGTTAVAQQSSAISAAATDQAPVKGDKKDIVFETRCPNLTKDESTVLVHYGKESTQEMLLLRLEDPNATK